MLRAGAGATRAGSYDLELVRDGTVVDKVAIASDDFTHTFTAPDPARYSVEVVREAADVDRYEVYSSPVWFESAENLTLGKLKLNKRKGTATLTATVAHPGQLKLKGKSLKSLEEDGRCGGQGEALGQAEGQAGPQAARQGQGQGQGQGDLHAHGRRGRRTPRRS